MSTEAARTARELQMLEGMVDCAYALGEALGAVAKREIETGRGLDHVDAFQKCFQAVRMGIRLCMALSAGKPAQMTPGRAADAERAEALDREPPEHEGRQRGDALERERDRDYEPVSLPKFLSTLGVVAREAARDRRLPAEAKQVLPALQTLLAQAQNEPPAATTTKTPTPGVAVLAQPGPGHTRDRLLGSAAVSSPGLLPRGSRLWSGSG